MTLREPLLTDSVPFSPRRHSAGQAGLSLCERGGDKPYFTCRKGISQVSGNKKQRLRDRKSRERKNKTAYHIDFVLRICNALPVIIPLNEKCRNRPAAGTAGTDAAKQAFRRFRSDGGGKRMEDLRE